jgi:CBS domain-containing protein
MSTTVADAMTTDPATVTRRTTAAEVARLMRDQDVGAVPIVDGPALVGIVTDRDLALRVVAEGLDPTTTYVEEIATPEPRAAQAGEALDLAYERMAAWRVRRLPVVDGKRLVGMLAQADLVHELKDKKAGQLVDEISQPGQIPYGSREVGLG